MTLAEANARATAPGMACEVAEAVIDGRPVKIWRNAPSSLAAVLAHPRSHGERIAFVHEDERVSFEAHWRAAAAFARTLSEAGVGKGDRVAVVMRNLPEWPVAFYAAAAMGAIVTPLNAWWIGSDRSWSMRSRTAGPGS